MDDEATEIQPTLTSTMGNVLLSQNNDKNDANDSTPTSSTDAASTCLKTPLNATDDPISSTSSDLADKNKVTVDIAEINKDMNMAKNQTISDSDVDLLDISIGNVSSEPITEEMEDIVQDLQKILGEAEPMDDLPSKKRAVHDDTSSDDKLLSALDDLGQKEDKTGESEQMEAAVLFQEAAKENAESEKSVKETEASKDAIAEAETPEVVDKPSADCEVAVKRDEVDASIEKLDVLLNESKNSTEDVCLNEKLEVECSEISKADVSGKELPEEKCDKEICIQQSDNKDIETTEFESQQVEMDDLSSQVKTCSEDTSTNEAMVIESENDQLHKQSTTDTPEDLKLELVQTISNSDDHQRGIPENLSESEENVSCDSAVVPEASTERSKDSEPVVCNQPELQEKPQLEDTVESSASEDKVSAEICVKKQEIIQEKPEDSQHEISEQLTCVEKKSVGDVSNEQNEEQDSTELSHQEKEIVTVEEKLIAEDTDNKPDRSGHQISEEVNVSDEDQACSNITEIVEENVINDATGSGFIGETVSSKNAIENTVFHDTTSTTSELVHDASTNAEVEVETVRPIIEELPQESTPTLITEDAVENYEEKVAIPTPIEKIENMETEEMEENSEELIENVTSELHIVDPSPNTNISSEDVEPTIVQETIEDLPKNKDSDIVTIPEPIRTEEILKDVKSVTTSEDIEEPVVESVVELDLPANQKESLESANVNEIEEFMTPELTPEVAEPSSEDIRMSPSITEIVEQETNASTEESECSEQVVPVIPEHVFEDTGLKVEEHVEKVEENENSRNKVDVSQPIIEEMIEKEGPSQVSIDNSADIVTETVCEPKKEISKSFEEQMVQSPVRDISESHEEELPKCLPEETTEPSIVDPDEAFAETEALKFEELVELENDDEKITLTEVDTVPKETNILGEQVSSSSVLLRINSVESKDEDSATKNMMDISGQDIDTHKISDKIESNTSEIQTIESESLDKTEAETSKVQNLDMDMSTKAAEELKPVVEEVIIKKTIIYEHDCHHKGGEGKLTHDKTIEIDACEKIEMNEDKVVSGGLNESNSSREPEHMEMKELEKNQVEYLKVPEDPKNKDNSEPFPVSESEPFEKHADDDEKNVESTTDALVESESSTKPDSELHKIESTEDVCKPSIPVLEEKVDIGSTSTSHHSKDLIQNEVDEAVKHIVLEDKIHDQTTAAVQSILDNMLAEEQDIVEISQKDEGPVVHSSYSSYELAKAVQQIQDISPADNTEEISPEGLAFVSGSEKPMQPSENENFVHPEIAEKVKQCIEKEKVATIQQEALVCSQTTESGFHPILPEAEKASDSILGKQLELGACSTQETQKVAIQHSDIPLQKEPEVSVIQPSIDLSEESSSEESLEDDNTQSKISSTTPAELTLNDTQKHVETPESSPNENIQKYDSRKGILKEVRQSSRVGEKSKDRSYNSKESINEPLSINIDETEKEKSYSPRITIKPIREEEPTEEKEEHKGSLKITITKQSDNTHSILKICSPDVEQRNRTIEAEEQNIVPKLVIKTADVEQHSPKMSTRSSKQSISTNANQRSGSPRITIKPIPKPESKEPIGSPLKITIKPMGKPEEFSKHQQQRHSPKLPRCKLDDDHYGTRSKVLKSSEISEVHSPKVTIKPVVKPDEIETTSMPKITIKPIEKPESEAKTSPKITIKPVIKPVEMENEPEDEFKKRIVLKINKGTIPTKDSEKSSRKREHEDDKSEKLAKIKLKFSKGGDAHIVHEASPEKHSPNKRTHDVDLEKCKRFKGDNTGHNSDEDVKIIEDRQSPIVISEDSRSQDSVILVEEMKDPLADVPQESRIVAVPVIPAQPPGPKKRGRPRKVPLVTRDEFANMQQIEIQHPAPSLIVEQAAETESTGRPKRSCRGQSVRDTLGIKPRKPKAPPKVRGGKRGGGKGVTKKSKEQSFSEEKIELIKQSLTEEAVQTAGLLKLSKKNQGSSEQVGPPFELKGLLLAAKDQNIIEVIEIDSPSNSPKSLDAGGAIPVEESPEVSTVDITVSDVEMQPPTPVIIPHLNESTAMDISHSSDIAIFEEETRMSADVNSRAQTPAKQVVSSDVVVEESQSSMQSTATTESGKISRKSRLEVHQEPDTAIVTADQLNEYYWGGNGPFMIQEQVAQFLGIKSFKRKYPGLPRRMVDMQERDYIRENGLASESMCDLGLTAVNSSDILDIMYSDFQDKYEEYCKYQRDKQAKDLINKQKALTLASGQEKNKLDIMEQAIQSAAAYNANFNKVRKEQRRACMDLQTMNVHYPKGKIKPVVMPKIGHYPVAVVPGQYTDYYKEFTPTELNNLPLNTMLYKELHRVVPDVSDSESDSSGSDSDDTSSSDSDSDSSCDDGCKMCTSVEKKAGTARKSPIHAGV